MNSKILRNSGQDSTEVQNNKNHCFILLLPQICNSVQKKVKQYVHYVRYCLAKNPVI